MPDNRRAPFKETLLLLFRLLLRNNFYLLYLFAGLVKNTQKGRDSFIDMEEANLVLRKIRDAWNSQVAEKYGRKTG